MAYPDFSYRGRPLAVPPMITSPYKPPSVTHPVEGHARVTDAFAASIAKSVYMPLDLYLTGKLGFDTRPALDTFKTGLQYIVDAKDGFMLAGNAIPGKTRKTSPAEFGIELPSPYDLGKIEAYNHMMIIFANMPLVYEELHSDPQYAARRNAVRPPATPEETYGRIVELETEMRKIINGTTKQETFVMAHDPLFRTHTFFQVANTLADKFASRSEEVRETQQQQPREIDERVERDQRLRRLLGWE